jgi:O-antigen/teichoic acid export membrane protein
MAESLKDKTVKGVSWSFVEQVLTRGVNFVIGIILARLLSPTDYGLVGMLGIFIAVSQLFVDGGLASALIRQKDASDEDYSTVYIINLTLSVFFYFLLFFTAPLVADFYDQPLLKPLMRVVALILIIGSLASVQGTLLAKRVDFKSKTLISLATSVISGIAGIVCALKGLGVWALVAQSLTGACVATLFTLCIVRWMPRLVFSKASFRKLFSFSSKILAASIISTIYDNAYPMVIGKKFSAKEVGLFTRGSQFPSMANSTLVSTFNRVAYPVLSQLQDDDEQLLHFYEKYIQVFCFIAFPVLMLICGCARPLVSLLLTDKWIECVPLMQIICFSLLPNGLIQINLNLLYVKGRSDLVLRMEIIKKLIMFGVLFLSIFFGLKGICAGMVVNALIDLYFSSYYTKKILSYGLGRQLRAVAPYFLISLVILAESLLVSHFFSSNWLSLLIAAVVTSLSFWSVSKATNLYAYRETLSLVEEKLLKKA